MSDAAPADQWLFSYGTLRLPDVQMATFNRLLDSAPDSLCGYDLSLLAITDAAVIATSGSALHPIIRRTGNAADEVAGVALAVTEAELIAADGYEVADYRRISVTLKSGRQAFVYIAAQP